MCLHIAPVVRSTSYPRLLAASVDRVLSEDQLLLRNEFMRP